MPDGNAVEYFVDRHEVAGRTGATAFADPWRSLAYGESRGDEGE